MYNTMGPSAGGGGGGYGGGGGGGGDLTKLGRMVREEMDSIRDSLRKAGTLQQDEVLRQFKDLRGMVDELAQDTSRGIGASRQAITDLLRNLEGVSGQIQQNTNNTAASIQALRDGQAAVDMSLKGIEASVDGLWAEQEAMKNRLLQETLSVQAKLDKDASPEIQNALATIENQLVSNNQLALKDGGELKDAVQTLLRSQAQAAEALAEHVTRGIQASAIWQEQIGQQLGALTREGVEVLASRQEELANRQAVLSGRQDEIANVTRAAASGIRNQLND